MDNRLVVTALLVTLLCMCFGTPAMAMEGSMNVTGSMNATGSMNMTKPKPPMNMTGPMNTTKPKPPMNMTGPMNTTKPKPPMNMTTPMPNTTVTPPPLEPNSTVQELTSPVNRQECRKKQFCAAQPAGCDPSSSDSCYFFSAKPLGGRNMRFIISGKAGGYLASSLSATGANDTSYICAKGKNKVKFFGASLVGGRFKKQQVMVNNVRAKVKNGIIQCKFDVTLPKRTARSAATTFALALAEGAYNATSGELGAPNTILKSDPVNLADANSTVTNQVNSSSTTVAPTTTASGHGVSLQQCLSQALLITLGVVGLALL